MRSYHAIIACDHTMRSYHAIISCDHDLLTLVGHAEEAVRGGAAHHGVDGHLDAAIAAVLTRPGGASCARVCMHVVRVRCARGCSAKRFILLACGTLKPTGTDVPETSSLSTHRRDVREKERKTRERDRELRRTRTRRRRRRRATALVRDIVQTGAAGSRWCVPQWRPTT